MLMFEVLGVLLWVCPPEVSVVPAASLRRPWSISAVHVTQRTDNCCSGLESWRYQPNEPTYLHSNGILLTIA